MNKNIIYLIIHILVLNVSFGAQIVKAWVYTNEGSSADAFEYSYKGPHYYYTYIYTQLDNGKVLKYCINLTDTKGTTCPAPTILLNYTLPNGTTVEVFEQKNGKSEIKKAEYDENGALTNWPMGFFFPDDD